MTQDQTEIEAELIISARLTGKLRRAFLQDLQERTDMTNSELVRHILRSYYNGDVKPGTPE